MSGPATVWAVSVCLCWQVFAMCTVHGQTCSNALYDLRFATPAIDEVPMASTLVSSKEFYGAKVRP
eukprot:666276-Pyramimonas_sp.AAC.1